MPSTSWHTIVIKPISLEYENSNMDYLGISIMRLSPGSI